MAEPMLDVVEGSTDVGTDEWYEAPNPYASQKEWMDYLQAGGMVVGTAVNVVSAVVLITGLVKKVKHRRAQKNMTAEERALANNPLYRIMVEQNRTAEQMQADIRALLANGDKIAAEVRRMSRQTQTKVA